MLCYEGRVSLYCFLGTVILILSLSIPQLFFDFVPNFKQAVFWGPLFYYVLLNLLLRFGLKGNDYQIAIRASFLGFIFAGGVLITINSPTSWKPFGLYAAVLSFFHYSEFLAIAWCNPKTLGVDSFILNHSVHYAVAAALSWVEFIVEAWLYPNIKTYFIFWIIGFSLCVFGEVLRKLAMITASTNFNHLVQFEKAADHTLVTCGVYSFMRHPSYAGWFLWSIGTQLLLFNPFCIVMYTSVSWKFFKDRIFLEEITLLNFFGEEYYEYQQKVPTGLPFIKGYQHQSDH